MAETEPAPVEVPQTEEPAPAAVETPAEDGVAGTKRKLDDVEPTGGEEDPHIAKRPSFNGPEATENGVEVSGRSEIRGAVSAPYTLPGLSVVDHRMHPAKHLRPSTCEGGHPLAKASTRRPFSLLLRHALRLLAMHAFNACFAVMPVNSGVTGRSTRGQTPLQETAAEADPEPEELAPGVDAPPGVETAEEPAPTEQAPPEQEATVAEAVPEQVAIAEISPEQQLAEQQAAAAAVLAAAAAPVAAAVDPYPQVVAQQAAVPDLQGLTQVIHISAGMVGKLIGKAGETIKGLQYSTNARIQVRCPPPTRVPTFGRPC